MRFGLIALAAAASMCVTTAEAQQRSHTYVIVHGAWGGGWD